MMAADWEGEDAGEVAGRTIGGSRVDIVMVVGRVYREVWCSHVMKSKRHFQEPLVSCEYFIWHLLDPS